MTLCKKMLLTMLLANITSIAMAPTFWDATIEYPTPIVDLVKKRNKDILITVIPKVEKPHTEEQARIAYLREKALGDFQIRPIMIDEVNQILGHKKYVHRDALDFDKALEMFCIYQQHYNPNWDLKKGAYLWVGGAAYYRANSDQWKNLNAYLYKVKSKL